MPSDKHNSITTQATGLIFSLLNVASAGHTFATGLIFSLLNVASTGHAFFIDLPVSYFVSHSSLLTAKGVDVVAGLPTGGATGAFCPGPQPERGPQEVP